MVQATLFDAFFCVTTGALSSIRMEITCWSESTMTEHSILLSVWVWLTIWHHLSQCAPSCQNSVRLTGNHRKWIHVSNLFHSYSSHSFFLNGSHLSSVIRCFEPHIFGEFGELSSSTFEIPENDGIFHQLQISLAVQFSPLSLDSDIMFNFWKWRAASKKYKAQQSIMYTKVCML